METTGNTYVGPAPQPVRDAEHDRNALLVHCQPSFVARPCRDVLGIELRHAPLAPVLLVVRHEGHNVEILHNI